jgi:hypothetical protein
MTDRVQPTAEQWKCAEERLIGSFGHVQLQCDAYTLTLECRLVKPRRYSIYIFIDGWFRGEWLLKDCEERRRFLRPVTRPLHSRKFIGAMKKIYGKKKLPDDCHRTVTYHHPDWPSFGPLRRHLLNHNKSVRITKIGGEELAQ